MDTIFKAFVLIGEPQTLLFMLLAAIFGLFVGAIPGLTATMATALLIPFTFFMDPVPAIAVIVTTVATAILQATFRAPCCVFRARPPLRPIATNPMP